MKIGYTVTFHHSSDIRPNGKKVLVQNIESVYSSIKSEFYSYIIDNQSMPSSSFSEVIDISAYSNMNYTYVKNQYEKGITGAWSMGISQAIADGCDIVILTTDDVIIDTTINNLIEYISNDPKRENSIYGPVANGVTVPLQSSKHPTNKIIEIPGISSPYHLGGHMYAFTKEFYHRWKSENGDLFIINNPYNGGDGKWGGNEGNVMYWAEQGARCVIVGTCWIDHQLDTRYSYRIAKNKDKELHGNSFN